MSHGASARARAMIRVSARSKSDLAGLMLGGFERVGNGRRPPWIRWRRRSDSDERQQPARIAGQNGVDFVFAEIAPHQRHHVLEDMPVAMTAVFDETRLVADVVRDEDALEKAAIDELAQGLQP